MAQKRTCGIDHPQDPTARFCCKMQYWATEGIPGVGLPDHAEWTGPTVRERVAETVANAKRNGVELQYTGRQTLV